MPFVDSGRVWDTPFWRKSNSSPQTQAKSLFLSTQVTSCVRREEQSLSPGLFENQCKQMSSLMPGTSQALSYGCGSSSLSNNVYGWRRVWGLELLLPLLPHLQKEWTHPSLQRKILSVSHLLPWGEAKNNQRWNKQIQLLCLLVTFLRKQLNHWQYHFPHL